MNVTEMFEAIARKIISEGLVDSSMLFEPQSINLGSLGMEEQKKCSC